MENKNNPWDMILDDNNSQSHQQPQNQQPQNQQPQYQQPQNQQPQYQQPQNQQPQYQQPQYQQPQYQQPQYQQPQYQQPQYQQPQYQQPQNQQPQNQQPQYQQPQNQQPQNQQPQYQQPQVENNYIEDINILEPVQNQQVENNYSEDINILEPVQNQQVENNYSEDINILEPVQNQQVENNYSENINILEPVQNQQVENNYIEDINILEPVQNQQVENNYSEDINILEPVQNQQVENEFRDSINIFDNENLFEAKNSNDFGTQNSSTSDKVSDERLTLEEIEDIEQLIEVRNLQKSFTKGKLVHEVLKGVNFDVPKGKITTIVGPSGSGKTTILNLISGLDGATKGSIMFDEEEVVDMTDSQLVRYRLENIGFVFQSYNLIPNMTIFDNVKMTADLADDPMDVQTVLDLVGLGEVGNKYPHQLSGGMQQRASFARAIVKHPKVLVCDEPTGALDERTGKEILQMITDLVDKISSTIIIVTHNPGIKAMSHSVIEVKDGLIKEQYYNRNQVEASEVKWA